MKRTTGIRYLSIIQILSMFLTVAIVLSVATTLGLSAQVPQDLNATADPDVENSSFVTIESRGNVFTGSTQENAAVDVGPDGRVVLVWDSRRQEAGTYGVYARCFDALGRPITHEVHVNEYVKSHQRLPGVAFAGGDEVWFVWDSHGQDGQAGSIVARRFSSDLMPAGPEIGVNSTREGDQTYPVISGRTDGSALVAWSTTLQGGGSRSEIRARLVDSSDRTIGEEIVVGQRSDGWDILPTVAPLPDKRTLIVWARSHSKLAPNGIFGRLIGADGRPDGDEFIISPPDDKQHIEPSVAAGPDGRFIVAWLTGTEDGYAVAYRRFENAVEPIGQAELIADPTTGWKSGVAAAMSMDGRFFVSFNSDGEDGSGEGIFTREFNSDGTLRSVTRVNRHTDGQQALTVSTGARRVAWSPLGQLVHSWNGDAGTGDNSAVHITMDTPAYIAVGDPPDLGVPKTAQSVTSEEVMAAIPPIWNPDYEPIDPLPFGVRAGGDFGFEAVTYSGWTPPDPELAVGPTDIVVMTNGEISTFTKSGIHRWRDEIENSFGFWGELGTDNFVFDPEVKWDPHSRRFFAMACERSDNYRSNFLLAVSKDESPDDRDDWYKYRLDVTSLAGNDIDSPNLSMSTDYVLLTADFFGPDKYLIYILYKNPLLNGGTPVEVSELITGSGQQSMGIPVVYDNDDRLYILQSTEYSNNTEVIFHAISNPFTSYSRETYSLTVPDYQYPASPPQRGSSSRPFLFEPRFWSVALRNGSMWAVHHVNSSRTRVRWYEFALNGWPTTGSPSIAQWGEIDLGSGIYTYFPSIHVDDANNAAITFARSASNEYISIGRVVRDATDPLNRFRPAQVVQISQNPHNSGRWGDYSGTQADNEEPRTFWGHHEFTDGSNYSWRTWAARYDMRSEPMILTVDPLFAGETANMEVTGATPGNLVFFVYSLEGTGIYDVSQLNAILSLENPSLGTSTVADEFGTASVDVTIPPGAAGLDVWIQAIERTHTTNWVRRTIN
jgi:hypothetical protein